METTPNLSNVQVSMFCGAFGQEPRDVALVSLLGAIQAGRYAEQVERLRQLRASDPEAYQREKRTLPAFLVSGTARTRREPREHSGLLQIDLDKLNGTLDAVRARVKADQYVAFGFVSPSGDGLKLGLRIDGTRHAESFRAAETYFRETYSVAIDPAVKDRLRLCFVSHDPDLWQNVGAQPLPIPDASPAPPAEPAPAFYESATPTVFVLPSGAVTISESARGIFERIAETKTMFWRGGVIVELVEVDGSPCLGVLDPDAFRSRVERHGKLCAWRSDGERKAVLKPALMPRDTAKALLATAEARELLPPIASVLSCPVIVEPAPGEVAILGKGYHPDQGGLLITGGELPPQVPFEEAVAALKWIINEFNFQSPADHSRALAAIITPALRLGGALPGKVPIDAAEADKSQAGKGHRLEINCSFYRESAYIVTQRKGGVGGLDESFASALVSGRPFICFDNVRGKLDSPHVESYFTAPGMFPARVPKVGEVLINAKRFLIQLTSNGIESTTDLANRSSICRIRYRPHFAYRDTLGELKSRQPYFLGCVFSVVAEWIAAGKPRTKDCRHHFREWAQSLDWICRNLLGTAPLMDGHEAAQERASNPSLTWLRAVALAIAAEGRIPATLTATDICELCTLHGIAIPGEPKTAEDAPPQVGRLMRPVFANSATVVADEFEITRGAKEYRKPSGDVAETPAYTFNRESQ